MPRTASLLAACCCATALVSLGAQQNERVPTAQLVPAPRLVMPGAIDSNIPLTWNLVDGRPTLFAMASWGGIPALLAGPGLDRMERIDAVTLTPHPGYGVWIESVLDDESGTWYGYYHHEIAGEVCGRPVQSILRIGAARSVDRGLTWEDLGVVLEGPPESIACATNNRFVLGGVGDLSVMLDPEHRDLFLFVSQYPKDRSAQGVAVARLAWADRDAPEGRVTVWRDGVWLPPRRIDDADGNTTGWTYPAGTMATRRRMRSGDRRCIGTRISSAT